MKKELILLACMTAGPYLLNSAGQWADTTEPNFHTGIVSNTVSNSHNYPCTWLDLLETYSDLVTYGPAAYAVDSGCRIAVDRPPSGTLQQREQKTGKSSIRANWVLDTLASVYNEMLVYKDKDEPGLKAVLFTDDAGNMLLQLEQDGKIREIRVQKVEFHTPVNIKPGRHQLHKWIKSDLSGEKGAAYVPV